MELLIPSRELLVGYVDAIRRGWSGDRVLFGSTDALLALAESDPDSVLKRLTDRSAHGVRYFGDGTTAPVLPALFRWMWDEQFVGNVDLRWPATGDTLPDDVPGHIGYGTVEWMRGRGYATRGLAMMLDLARDEGMAEVELVTDVDNVASQRVIERNGGVLVEEFTTPERIGGSISYRWRIDLD